MAETLTIAVDGGPAGVSAMDWVIDRARSVPTNVRVITVEELQWLPVGADERIYRRKYSEALRASADYLAKRTGILSVTTGLLRGNPADTISHAAASADCLVMGSVRRSNSSGALHGTLGLKIAARAKRRMTIVPLGWSNRVGPIVVGVDEDESSDRAVDYAADEAARLGSAITLIYAWSLPQPFTILEGFLPTNYPTLEALHRSRLDDAVLRAKARQPSVDVTPVLQFGHAASVLAAHASASSQTIIGKHQPRVAANLFLGSAGHDLLLAAPAPVTIIPETSSR